MLNVQEMNPADLNLWEENPRINDHAVDAVAKSIEQFGFNVPILCDQNHMIIAGHTRWKAAQQLGLRTVPVIQLEMTETQRKAFAVADNKTAEIADWNLPDLEKILSQLVAEELDLVTLGFSEAEIEGILGPEHEIDWSRFEDGDYKKSDNRFVFLKFKIPMTLEKKLKEMMIEYAKEKGLSGENDAEIYGSVMINIFGLNSG